MRRLLILVLLIIFNTHVKAGSLLEYSTVNSEYLLLWFEGISVSTAEQASTYEISSPDDPDYSAAQPPLAVGRKSKKWRNSTKYWMYLELPHSLNPGSTYTVTYPSLASGDGFTFVFEEEKVNSESIHLNHIGYNPDARKKYAYLHQWMGTLGAADMTTYEGAEFHLIDTVSEQVVYTGTVAFRMEKETNNARDSKDQVMPEGLYGSPVWECDFSDFSQEGVFRLVIDGIGTSDVFRVDRNVYKDLVRLTSRGLYHYRSGPERTLEHTDWIKPADHIPGVTNGGNYSVTYSTRLYSRGKNAFSDLPANATEWNMPNNRQPWMNDDWGVGGYFDAGDYDKNPNHFRIARNMLQVFELAPGSFKDDEYNIPESGNGIPDFLDEARWVIDFYRNLGGPTGGACGGLETTGHNGSPSWDEERYDQWYAYGEEAQPTYLLAGGEAHLAYCLTLIDRMEEVDTLTNSAKAHYEWAVNADSLHLERAYAAAALFKLTGEKQYLDDYKLHTYVDEPNAGNSQSYATWLYVTTNRSNMDFELKEMQKQAVINWAENSGLSGVENNATRVIRNNTDRLWLGESSAPVLLDVIMAHYLTRDPEILDYLYTTADYYNGGNPMNLTWITGAESIGAEDAAQQLLATDTKAIKELNPDAEGTSIPGTIVYGVSINVAWTGTNAMQQNSLYPYSVFGKPVLWPAHEVYFDWGGCVETNEFTVHQTMGPATATYGYLSLWEDVASVQLENILLERDSITISAGLSDSVHVNVFPFNASNQNITWSSLDTDIAIVDERGIITGAGEGETSIVVSAAESDAADTLFVKVLPFFELLGIEIVETGSGEVKDTIRLDPNEEISLQVLFDPVNASDKKLVWQTENTAILALDEYGQVRSGSQGITFAVAKGSNGVADTVVIVVASENVIPGKVEMEHYISSLDVSSSGRIRTGDTEFDGTEYLGWLGEGDWANYSIDVQEEADYIVTANIAAPSTQGLYKIIVGDRSVSSLASSTGGWITWRDQELDEIIHLTPDDSVFNFSVVNSGFNINYLLFQRAPDPVLLESLDFEYDTVKLYPGDYKLLHVTFVPSDAADKSGAWTSSVAEIAAVTQTGMVAAYATGITEISFTSNQDNELSASLIVEVLEETNTVPVNYFQETRIYPVPLEGPVVRFSRKLPGGTSIEIYSAGGALCFKKEVSGSSNQVELPFQPGTGLYIVKVSHPQLLPHTYKVLPR